MARMIGNTRVHQPCKYGCCDNRMSKDSATRIETKLWQKDLHDELEDVAREEEFFERHAIGICKNNDGSYGCDRCYNSANPVYAEDLDDIEGVTSNLERLEPWQE